VWAAANRAAFLKIKRGIHSGMEYKEGCFPAAFYRHDCGRQNQDFFASISKPGMRVFFSRNFNPPSIETPLPDR
jgi:hypothetical protein